MMASLPVSIAAHAGNANRWADLAQKAGIMVAGTQVTFWGVLGGALFIVLLVFCIMLVGKLLADVLISIEKLLDE